MEALQQFLQMDGHGFYVWLSYGLTLAALLYHGVQPYWAHNREINMQRQQHRRAQAHSAAQTTGNE